MSNNYQEFEQWRRNNLAFEPCHFCGEMPTPMIGEPFSHFFGVSVCEWCWESDEYMDWSEQKWREAGIPLGGKTGIVSDDYARYVEWKEAQKSQNLNLIQRIKGYIKRLQSWD